MSNVAILTKLHRNAAALLQRSQLHQAQRRTYRSSRPCAGSPSSSYQPVHDANITPELFDKEPPARISKVPPSSARARRGPKGGLIHSLILSRARGRELFLPIEAAHDVPGANFTRPMLTYVQITSAPTADTPGASVLLHFDDRRYAFGRMAEGTQRVFTQRKVGVGKLDELFISGPVRWSSTGGLLGMILTIADVLGNQKGDTEQGVETKKKKKSPRQSSTPSLKIYGAENITHMIATARKFIFRKGLPLRLHEILHEPGKANVQGRKPDFEDANVKVWYVSLLPEETEPHGRKRSHDDMESGDDAENGRIEGKKLVKSVVDNMFDSDWDLDAMVETTLHKVPLPATIFVKEDGKLKKYDGPMPADNVDCPDIPVLVRTPWPAVRVSDLPRTTPSQQSISYIVKGQPRRGKFNVQAAQKLGVEKTDFKHLTAGKTVKGKDGIEVTPEMCVDPAIEGHGFAFIDLPDLTYVDAFLARPEWEDLTIMNTVDAIFWNLGRGVLQDERIQKFMKDRQTKYHRVFSPDVSPNIISMESPASQMLKMHKVDPDRFPSLVYNNEGAVSFPSDLFEVARVGAKLQLAPQVELKNDEIVPLMNSKDKYHDIPSAVAKVADKARARLADQSFIDSIEATEADIPNRDTEIIPLGTGSSLPSKYRNVSATLLRVPGIGSYLFDAGESTLGQLRRMYGFAKTDEILADLKAIWISHLHADHHLGTASIIKAWRDATASLSPNPPRLLVASHVNMLDWLREYADVEDYGYSRLVLASIRGPGRPESVQEPFILNPNLAAEMGLVRIDAARVDHCHGALACVFTFPSGLRVAYSGDCRPSRAFAEIGRDATLLIHESTLDDELQGDALAKKHCTMSEALSVARNMRARRVLLTHFSQRYPKIPNKLDLGGGEDGVKDQVALLAFDHMCVKLGDFKRAELFLPALRELLDLSDGKDD
ncbi:hypothetical protein N0V82_004020 [Gnomoniopsis sp. IMI 355080]|nr:hypothetical protein N0V82_004020 [Gnomoniopsis sp. IMI 355080]